jgi:hypothetical protein
LPPKDNVDGLTNKRYQDTIIPLQRGPTNNFWTAQQRSFIKLLIVLQTVRVRMKMGQLALCLDVTHPLENIVGPRLVTQSPLPQYHKSANTWKVHLFVAT